MPGKVVPVSRVSTKNWVSKTAGVESKGRPRAVGSTSSAPAIEWLVSEGEPRRDVGVKYRLRCEKGDYFCRAEASVGHAGKDGLNAFW